MQLRWKWLIAAGASCTLAAGSAPTATSALAVASSGRTSAPIAAHAVTVKQLTGITVKHDDYWAGYVAKARNGKGSHYVTSTFTVPTLNCAAGPGLSVSHLVGLGGYTDGNINAIAVTENCGTSGSFYDVDVLLPFSGGTFGSIVSPGDTVTASVRNSKSQGGDNFVFTDDTSGKTYTYFNRCTPTGCGISTSEVVTDGHIFNMSTADFASIKFGAIQMTPNGSSTPGPLTSTRWYITKLVMYGPVSGQPDVTPGPLTSANGSSAFTNTWLLGS